MDAQNDTMESSCSIPPPSPAVGFNAGSGPEKKTPSEEGQLQADAITQINIARNTRRDDAEKRDSESDFGVGSADDDENTDDDGDDDDIDTVRDADGNGNGQQGVVSKVLSRVLSRSSTKSLGPPPDGGLKAWTTVACAHLVVVNTWGIITSFGIFQSYYTQTLGRAPADISWIGSVQIFLLFFIGTFTGRLTDAGYFRAVFALGSLLQLLGIFASSWAAGSYWQLFLAQGVCMGVGNGCMFCPTMAIASTYFSKKRMLAIGIVASGSATGGLVFPVMVRELLPRVGFAWTMRAIGLISLLTLAVCNVFLRPRVKPRKAGPLVEWKAFKEMEYTFYMLGSFSCFLGVYVGFFYLTTFSRDVAGMSYTESLNLLLILNGVGIPGRLIPNFLADKYGPLNMFVPVVFSSAVCVFGWMAVGTPGGLYAWAVVYGMAGGAIQSLFPAALASLTTDYRKTGVRMGMVMSINSFATLLGPPIAGVLVSEMNGKYYGAQAFAGATLFMGMGFLIVARMVKARRMEGGPWMVKV